MAAMVIPFHKKISNNRPAGYPQGGCFLFWYGNKKLHSGTPMHVVADKHTGIAMQSVIHMMPEDIGYHAGLRFCILIVIFLI